MDDDSATRAAAMARLFWALVPPPALVEAVVESTEPLRARWPDLRWVPAPQLHVTVAFLPRFPVDRVEALVASVREQVAGLRPVQVRLGPQAQTPSRRRSDVIWLPVDPLDAPTVVAERVTRGCLAADPDTAADAASRPWRGHLTLARVPRRLSRQTPPIGPLVAAAHHGTPLEWRADRVVLVRSELGADGARHTPVAEAAWQVGSNPGLSLPRPPA